MAVIIKSDEQMCKGYINRRWDGPLLLIWKCYFIIKQDKLKTVV